MTSFKKLKMQYSPKKFTMYTSIMNEKFPLSYDVAIIALIACESRKCNSYPVPLANIGLISQNSLRINRTNP